MALLSAMSIINMLYIILKVSVFMPKAEIEVVRFIPNGFLTASDDGHNNGYTDIGDLMSETIFEKIL